MNSDYGQMDEINNRHLPVAVIFLHVYLWTVINIEFFAYLCSPVHPVSVVNGINAKDVEVNTPANVLPGYWKMLLYVYDCDV